MSSDPASRGPAPQWEPTDTDLRDAQITRFAGFVAERHGVEVDDYHSLWRWSVSDVGAFWQAVWEWAGVRSVTEPGPALADSTMPGAVWFPGARLNYVEHVFRHSRGDETALLRVHEGTENVGDTEITEMSWDELRGQVAAFAATLRAHGVGSGDRVVGYLPNIPEAVVAFLATASLGAVWAACGQDYSAPAALDRLGQLEPKVLVTADGYRFGGRAHDRTEASAQIRDGLDSLVLTVLVPNLNPAADTDALPATTPARITWAEAVSELAELAPESVPFDHPLWVVFSSGTTGLPKGIVHGHGGVLLEHLKSLALQADLSADDTLFWYTSPSWMMWNYQTSGLLVGATVVCYDGSPSYPEADSLWDLAARTRATVLGTSPGYVLACVKAGAEPAADHDLSTLRTVGITGSTLPASSSLWLSEHVGASVPVMSISGGTDVVSAFVGGARTVPVWPGELSAPYLGVALAALDEGGHPVVGEVGELVVTEPMPSMPVRFWNDPDGRRYRDAYFDMYPGVWRHGDWVTITDRGSVLMHGRSDSTLNRHGIRMGSADIYQVVERIPEIAEALVLGIERDDGGYWMPLFVVLDPGAELDAVLQERIRTALREQLSPRHVPDDIIVAPGIPHTRTGKKLEVPLKRILQGADASRAVDPSAIDAPELIDWFVRRSR
ncbi:acetoacetate--CoA ligase [Rhodococcus triatomae]|uniref:Acetoacetyl-CoA synthetase n=1 Tax=Rhodococcus triatomae TaxID=300028 RepID=A0A1G8JNA2_9NOCA|nr:acetoacetate--CoA ligase [Rhodococcus triatomae]QNG19674.1 acetoacetate--CoA ligase [Rhodococcus triatomae]QNG24411.1 acetoacetate--CoA ligase [Rhodococcus triatomae]SDI32759.1 acetoacetyl-CoA synthetase [Rhodococcus triatomae]